MGLCSCSLSFFVTAQQPTQLVAFTAYADRSRDLYDYGIKVQFDDVITNIGYHFTNSTTFICPVDGLYFFSFHVMSGDDVNVYPSSRISLMVGGTRVVSAWADHHEHMHHAQASNSAFVQCSAGQGVHLETYGASLVYSSSYHQGTFSGFLVSENQAADTNSVGSLMDRSGTQ